MAETGLIMLGGSSVSRCDSAEVEKTSAATGQPGVIGVEFLYDQASFPSCHASTIVDTKSGLVAAWFGGSDEGNDDVGIWLSRRISGDWLAPIEVANGVDSDGRRYPCWNPVLSPAADGSLLLFYKVGPSPSRWWGLVKRSSDMGQSWSSYEHLPLGLFGPIRNKPIQLTDKTLLCGSSTEHDGWRVHMERASPDLKTWEKTAPLNDGKTLGLIQPTILTHPGGRLQILCRSRQKRVFELWSSDAGKTWSTPEALDLPNPNSGIDGVTLADGRQLLVYNHTQRGRSPLNVAVSSDGRKWQGAVVLENTPGEFSYPAVIESRDGQVHITYTWNRRRIRHVTIDPAKPVLADLPP
ncbi:MAG: sialidase [Planctomycetaceae bacterium]|nr:sialidase [Planctomycetaceae bacterium]